jgi:hypothetical protein
MKQPAKTPVDGIRLPGCGLSEGIPKADYCPNRTRARTLDERQQNLQKTSEKFGISKNKWQKLLLIAL